MIDYASRTIYVDYSTLAVFKACKEKCRLGNVRGWRAVEGRASLSFGHAIHAGIQAYYDALAGGWHDSEGKWHTFTQDENTSPTARAQAAFLTDLQYTDAKIPVTLEATERRSLERGIALIEAYIFRYKDEPYDNLLRPDGSPYTEVGFKYYITEYEGFSVVYVGYIDRLMFNRAVQRPCIFELKTTTQGLKVFVEQCRPNHQITGYYPPALEINPDIRDCVWDAIFVSDRKPDLHESLKTYPGARFWMYGIDTEKDFMRHQTQRSTTDISEFMIDLEEDALEYCAYITSNKQRWPRTAPGACHSYGGCQFRKRCNVNLQAGEEEDRFMNSFFKVERWEPWRKIAEKIK